MKKMKTEMPPQSEQVKLFGTVIQVQLAWIVTVLIISFFVHKSNEKSLFYGEMTALMASVYLHLRIKTTQKQWMDAQQSLRQVQHAAVGRGLIVAVMLALPLIHVTHWHYGEVMLGFMFGQIGWVLGLIYLRARHE